MTPQPSFSRQQWIVLMICVAIFALGQFHRASGSVFTPILMEQYAVTATTVGGLVSAMFFATILAQLPFGIALDRIGPRLVLSICMIVIAAGTALFALAGSFQDVLAARVLIGIGLASMGAATHIIVARNFSVEDFGYVSGLVVTLGGIGGLLGTYPLAFMLARFAWSEVFAGVACATLLLAMAVFRAVRPGGETPAKSVAETTEGGYLSLLRQPEFLKILVLSVVSYAPITTVTGLWGGPFLQDVGGLSSEQAGAVLLVFFAATICGGYVFGRLDRSSIPRRRVMRIAIFVSAGSLLLLAVLPALPDALAILLLLIMVFSQQFYIPLAAHMRSYIADHKLGRAATLLTLVSVAAIPIMQLGFGIMLDLGASLGFGVADQFRLAFLSMAVVIAGCGTVYVTARHIG